MPGGVCPEVKVWSSRVEVKLERERATNWEVAMRGGSSVEGLGTRRVLMLAISESSAIMNEDR